uniref:Protein of unassigned function n=1 Tax=Methylobacterium oryzae CBMB20 TaxID=693986 RepID=A0A088B2B9_9HYPH|nr:protein of unassigned function [Methylobacterium oryzae CBMB20]
MYFEIKKSVRVTILVHFDRQIVDDHLIKNFLGTPPNNE